MAALAAVAGSPHWPSKTAAVAAGLLEALGGGTAVDLGIPAILDEFWSQPPGPTLAAALEAVSTANVVLVVSPVYKASFSGLLKAFLDRLPTGALTGKWAIPAMVGASRDHRLAVEWSLKPVLAELGAFVPPQGLYVLESEVQGEPPRLDPLTSERLADCCRRQIPDWSALAPGG